MPTRGRRTGHSPIRMTMCDLQLIPPTSTKLCYELFLPFMARRWMLHWVASRGYRAYDGCVCFLHVYCSFLSFLSLVMRSSAGALACFLLSVLFPVFYPSVLIDSVASALHNHLVVRFHEVTTSSIESEKVSLDSPFCSHVDRYPLTISRR
jgi:hypothetical protein